MKDLYDEPKNTSALCSSYAPNYCIDMTLREYYAGLAMQAILSDSQRYKGVVGVNNYEFNMAEMAVKAADALIEELNK